MFADDLTAFLEGYYAANAPVDKSKAVKEISAAVNLKPDGKLYIHQKNGYAVRFSFSAAPGFSNTVLGLSKLIKYDHLPVIVCLLRPLTYELMLANTTFLQKISHSSHALTLTNIKGSFLGHDIIRVYESVDRVENKPLHFDALFSMHQAMDLQENIERLVLATSKIGAIKKKLLVDPSVRGKIHQSILFSFRESAKIQELKAKLDEAVRKNLKKILAVAAEHDTNVNIRGNQIEQLITNDKNQHGLADREYLLPDGQRVMVDIKTSVSGKSSNPKLYNIDKQLQVLSDGMTACMIYFVHIHAAAEQISTYLVNGFDETMIDNTRVQFHWAGRDSRGVTQLDMKIQNHFNNGEWKERLNVARALRFVDELIDEKFK